MANFRCSKQSVSKIDTSLLGLFFVSFAAGSILPVPSEFALFAYLKTEPQNLWQALITATAGNTLGGISSYWIGRFLPQRTSAISAKAMQRVKDFGSPMLLLAWLPWIGDPLCLAAGWLKLNPWQCALFIAIGKSVRYYFVALAAK
jgi:membrane protein YqaA with SNARE-associated domain